MFLQAASNVGFADAGKLKKQIERISKNTAVNDFLIEVSSHLTPSNVISPSQLSSFEKLEESGEALEISEVFESVRYELHKKKRLSQKEQSLKKELSAAKLRQSLLEEQLKCLEAAHVAAMNDEDDLLKLVKNSAKETLQAKSKHKETRTKYSRLLSEVSKDCTLVSCNYENKHNKQCLLSLIDLDSFLLSEDEYSSQLTQHTKRQFQEVPNIVENLSGNNCELNSMVDTVLLQDECKEVKDALLDEIKRAANGYKNRKKRVVFSKADVARSEATLQFLQTRSSASKCGSYQDNRHIGALQSAVSDIDDQISYTVNAVLPGLLSKGSPMQKSHFLTGDFRNKLAEQQKITQKQKNLIDMLLQQCSRLTVLWMMLQFEKTQVSVYSKKMRHLSEVLTEALEASYRSCQNLDAIQQSDHSSKEPKAVIGSRDFVMLDLHKLLTSSSDHEEGNAVLHTVESAFQAAALLGDKQNSLSSLCNSDRSESFRLLQLSDSIRHLLWENNDPTSNSDDVILSTSTISDNLNLLEKDVANAKISVPKLLTKVDKKRAFLDHNAEVAQSRLLWTDFVAQATST